MDGSTADPAVTLNELRQLRIPISYDDVRVLCRSRRQRGGRLVPLSRTLPVDLRVPVPWHYAFPAQIKEYYAPLRLIQSGSSCRRASGVGSFRKPD